MASNRIQLTALIERGAIADEDVERAAQLAGLYPSGSQWRVFLSRLLLWLGSLALAFSVMFFVAYNWADMGRILRFALVEAALVLAVAVYWKLDGKGVAGQAVLMAATLLLGALLALVGQVYQSGADPWQLFFSWAMLMLPWAIIGRFAVIWVLWLALINLSVVAYIDAFGGLLGLSITGDPSLYWLLFLFNTLALGVWELSAGRWSWLAVSWARRLLALGSGIPVTLLAIAALFDQHLLFPAIWLAYPLWLAGFYALYRHLRPDLFMLAGCCLSSGTLTTFFIGRAILGHGSSIGLLLLAMTILGLSTAATMWLRRVHREMQA